MVRRPRSFGNGRGRLNGWDGGYGFEVADLHLRGKNGHGATADFFMDLSDITVRRNRTQTAACVGGEDSRLGKLQRVGITCGPI